MIEEIKGRGEPTIVFIYGDHLPTMGLKEEDVDSRYLYNTNYVMWDNIGLTKKDQNLAAYQVMAEVMTRAGIHSGTVFNYHQNRRKTKNYLKDLELLQYDILYGNQYVYHGKTVPFEEGHMVMGLEDVRIDSLRKQSENTYSIYGEGFNQNSSVYVNNEKQKTLFLNNTRLDFSDLEPENGDEIKVCQVGSKNRVFRESKVYIYQDGALTEKTEQDQAQEQKEE